MKYYYSNNWIQVHISYVLNLLEWFMIDALIRQHFHAKLENRKRFGGRFSASSKKILRIITIN